MESERVKFISKRARAQVGEVGEEGERRDEVLNVQCEVDGRGCEVH